MMLCEQTATNSDSNSVESCGSPHSSDSNFSDQPVPSYDDITLSKLLNKAKFPVFLGYSPSMDEKLAVKFFPFTNNKVNPCFVNEIRFANLRHQNVISTVHYETDREAAFEDGTKKISYTVMELAPYGDFFDVVMSQKVAFDDKLARTYFHQLIQGMSYLHSVGVAHLDLKLENLMMGNEYTLKIGDFDQAYVKGQSTIYSRGTVSYRAPEIFQRTCKNPEAADIYSAGIILFLFKCNGILPYSEQEKFKGIDLFELLAKNPKAFWEKHAEIQGKASSFFSEDFKALFSSMVKPNPRERVTLEQVKNSKWFNGPVYSDEELKTLMKKSF